MERIDLHALDLNLLVALERLLARRSVSDAAKDLGITQPAMSRTLQRLRDALGDPLLVRVGRGVVATDRAKSLVEPVEQALTAARRVFEPPARFDPATATGELVVAIGDEAQVAFADAICKRVWGEAPNIDLRFRALTAASVDDGRRGTIDLALAPDLSALPRSAGAVDLSDFVVKRVYVRKFAVASSAKHPRRRLSLDAWLAASHVLVGLDSTGRGFVDDILDKMGKKRRVAATVSSFTAVAALVANSELLAIVPEEVARLTPGLVAARPPIALPEIPIDLVWHPSRTADPRHRYLRGLVQSAVAERVRSWK